MNLVFPTPNVSTYQDLLQYNNLITNNMFGVTLLLIIFMVCFISSKRYSTEVAFTFASFTTMISSTMLAMLELVSSEIILSMIIIVAISLFFLKKGN